MGDKPDIVNFIKLYDLTDSHKDALKKSFQAHKRRLQRAMTVVDRGLQALAQKPKRKKTAKRRTAKRKAKRKG